MGSATLNLTRPELEEDCDAEQVRRAASQRPSIASQLEADPSIQPSDLPQSLTYQFTKTQNNPSSNRGHEPSSVKSAQECRLYSPVRALPRPQSGDHCLPSPFLPFTNTLISYSVPLEPLTQFIRTCQSGPQPHRLRPRTGIVSFIGGSDAPSSSFTQR